MTPLSDAAMARLRTAVSLPDLPDARYSLLEELGRGGMGAVYRGVDELLGREVAIKVAHAPVGVGGTTLADRLRTEARVLARLEHPGIIPVHDAGVLGDGRVFYVMKLVHGRTLTSVLDRIPDLDRRLDILERVAEATAFAHGQGVVHRDLKPDNIMVGDFGEVLVMDWGVAKVLGEAEAESGTTPSAGPGGTAPGTVMGTPGFMAPEQASAGPVDARADVHALGAVLVFLATGTMPTEAIPAAGLLEEARPIPRRLRAIAARCLVTEPAGRYAGAAELVEDLRGFRSGGRVSAYREGWLERLGRWASTYRTPILLVAAYLLMRVIVAFVRR
jgi:serine/threonine protein kinase